MVLLVPGLALGGPQALPPDHWAYAELEHFEARGLLNLDGQRPYSRRQVRGWVESLGAVDPTRLTTAEHERLLRLEDEFVRGDSLLAARFDPPLWNLADTGWRIAGDLGLRGGALAAARGEDPSTSWSHADFDLAVDHGDRFVYDTRVRARLAEETGRRTGENRLSSRERNWHGLTSDNDRAYVAFERGALRLSLGRDYLAWGSRRGVELLVSDAGLSLDALQVRLGLGRFVLSSATALLSAADNRNYAAHRLEVRLGNLRLGVQEAVVYQSPHFEPTYLFPIAFYYGNQFNERADDNVLAGADAKWVGRWGVLDAELLVDDFIYDGDPAPQKLGARIGAGHALGLCGTDLDLRFDYVRIDRWTFTHRESAVYYVAGGGDPVAGDPLLGHPLGPDADRWSIAATWVPHASTVLWLRQERTRRGEGNRDLSPWVPGSPYRLPFPSGLVSAELRTELGGRMQFGRHAGVQLAGTAERGAAGWSTGTWAEVWLDL